MNLHKHQLYLYRQHSESFKIWSASIRINTGGKSLIMKLGPDRCDMKCKIEYIFCARLLIIVFSSLPS